MVREEGSLQSRTKLRHHPQDLPPRSEKHHQGLSAPRPNLVVTDNEECVTVTPFAGGAFRIRNLRCDVHQCDVHLFLPWH